ncbi:hypothetical protein HDU76_003754 [Blyttiomyces sp. JEL0837]|nr:hypothetical protein HDU76_003754 [Blyttiomyces sp. JEL0837]
MKAYINREDIDFDSVESIQPPDQEWDLIEAPPSSSKNTRQTPEYPTRISKFSNVRNLTLYFPSNGGGDTTKIFYVGLKGEWTEVKKDPIITLYELAANPADHKTKTGAFSTNSSTIM